MAEFNYDSSTSVAYGNSANVKYVLGVSEDGTPVLLQWNSTTGAKAQIDDKLSKAGGSIGNLVVTGITVNGNAVVNGGLNVSNNIDTKTLKVSTRAAIGEDFGSSPTYALKVRGESKLTGVSGGHVLSIYNEGTLRAKWGTSSSVYDGIMMYSADGTKVVGKLRYNQLRFDTYGTGKTPISIQHYTDNNYTSFDAWTGVLDGKLVSLAKNASGLNPQVLVGFTDTENPLSTSSLRYGFKLVPSYTAYQELHVIDYNGTTTPAAWTITSLGSYTLAASLDTHVVSSDDRLKTRLSELDISLDELKELSTFNYYLTSDASMTPQIGMSAQEIQKLFPTLVKPIGKTPEGDDYLGLDYARLSVVSMAAVKLLSKELDSVKDRLSKIETKLGI